MLMVMYFKIREELIDLLLVTIEFSSANNHNQIFRFLVLSIQYERQNLIVHACFKTISKYFTYSSFNIFPHISIENH